MCYHSEWHIQYSLACELCNRRGGGGGGRVRYQSSLQGGSTCLNFDFYTYSTARVACGVLVYLGISTRMFFSFSSFGRWRKGS